MVICYWTKLQKSAMNDDNSIIFFMFSDSRFCVAECVLHLALIGALQSAITHYIL